MLFDVADGFQLCGRKTNWLILTLELKYSGERQCADKMEDGEATWADFVTVVA